MKVMGMTILQSSRPCPRKGVYHRAKDDSIKEDGKGFLRCRKCEKNKREATWKRERQFWWLKRSQRNEKMWLFVSGQDATFFTSEASVRESSSPHGDFKQEITDITYYKPSLWLCLHFCSLVLYQSTTACMCSPVWRTSSTVGSCHERRDFS